MYADAMGWHDSSGGRPSLLYAIRRRPWLLVVSMVAGIVLAAAVSAQQEAVYEATGRVYLATTGDGVLGTGTSPGFDNVRHARNQAQIIESSDVADRAVESLGGTLGARQLLEATSADASRETDIVDVTARSGSAASAVQLVDVVVGAYMSLTRDRISEQFRAGANAAEKAREELEAQLAQLEEQLADAPADAALPLERDAVAEQVAGLRGREAQMRIDALMPPVPVELYESPRAPLAPLQPRPLRDGALGALLGLAVGALLAWGTAVARPDAVDARTASTHLAAPVLASLGGRLASPRTVTGDRGSVDVGRMGRDPRVQAMLPVLDNALTKMAAPPTVSVLSVDGSEPSAPTALHLAAAAAADGRRVVLIDAAGEGELSRLVSGAGSRGPNADGRRRLAIHPNIDFFPFVWGPVGSDGGHEQRGEASFSRLHEAELEILHLAPLTRSSASAVLAEETAGLVVVVASRTPVDALVEVRERAALLGLPIVGLIFYTRSRSRLWRRLRQRRQAVGPQVANTISPSVPRDRNRMNVS